MAGSYLLLVACVSAVVAQAVAKPEQCTPSSWGDTYTTIPYGLPSATLAPGIRDWQVKIPAPPSCPPEFVRGMASNSCDYDQAPIAKFEGQFLLSVHRTGNLQLPAEVQVTIFCAPVRGSLLAVPNKTNIV